MRMLHVHVQYLSIVCTCTTTLLLLYTGIFQCYFVLYVLNNANSHSPIDDHKIAVGPEDEQLFHGNPASQLTKWTTLSHLEVKVCVTSCIDTCIMYKMQGPPNFFIVTYIILQSMYMYYIHEDDSSVLVVLLKYCTMVFYAQPPLKPNNHPPPPLRRSCQQYPAWQCSIFRRGQTDSSSSLCS